jgi:peptidoglycan/LPS O-acetylase OafA/YrhL
MQVWLILYKYTATIYELYKVGINAFFHGKNFTQTILRVVGLVIPIGILLSQLSTKSELLYAIGLLIMTIYLLWLKPLVMNLVSKKSIILVRFVNNIDVFVLCVIVIKYMINIYYIKNPHIIMLLWFANMIIAGNRGSDIIKLFFENRIMQFIGTISYALYLDHNLAITITGYIIPAQYWGLRIALILFLAFSGAYILHTYIEQPVQKRLMKMLT